MRRTMSTLAARLLSGLKKPDPNIHKTLQKAGEQQALFQLELPLDGKRVHHQYLTMVGRTQGNVTLSTEKPFFMVPESWNGKVFLFRFLMQPDMAKPPLLHKFKSRIVKVLADKKTIMVAVPREIVATEQRRNVRIALKPAHLPHVVVWGVRKDEEDSRGVRFNHHIIMELDASDEETRRTVLNLSAGGIRLSLNPKVLAQNKEWLEPGRRLVVQLVFSGQGHPRPSRHMFVSRVSNTRCEGVSRPELGVQFLAARVSDPSPRWNPLEKSGCEELARVVHSIQVLYYAEIKQRLAVREGTIRQRPQEGGRSKRVR